MFQYFLRLLWFKEQPLKPAVLVHPVETTKADLVVTGTLRGVHEAEYVELVERGEADEEEVPHHKDDAVAAVELPAVGVGGEHQEHHRGEKGESGVGEACTEGSSQMYAHIFRIPFEQSYVSLNDKKGQHYFLTWRNVGRTGKLKKRQ